MSKSDLNFILFLLSTVFSCPTSAFDKLQVQVSEEIGKEVYDYKLDFFSCGKADVASHGLRGYKKMLQLAGTLQNLNLWTDIKQCAFQFLNLIGKSLIFFFFNNRFGYFTSRTLHFTYCQKRSILFSKSHVVIISLNLVLL